MFGNLIDQVELRSVLSNLSHELCRPLVSLRAGFDLLLGESPRTITEDQRGHLLDDGLSLRRSLRLTRSYLDYAGIVQGSRPICLGSFTIGALIGEIDRQFGPVARARQLAWEAQRRLSGSRGDHRRLALPANLRESRVQRHEVHARGRPRSCHRESRGRLLVRQRLRHGPGIPAEALDRVFEPFFRLSRDEHSVIDGSGLGLAICRELVTQLHGEISLSSVPARERWFPCGCPSPRQRADHLPSSARRDPRLCTAINVSGCSPPSAAQLDRALQMRPRLGKKANQIIRLADRLTNRGFDKRLIGKSVADRGGCAVQRRAEF